MPRVPSLLPGQRLTSLPLTPAEAFVLAQIDGNVSERDLVAITGLSVAQVVAAIDRLVALGVVGLRSEEPKSSRWGAQDRPQAPPQSSPPRNALESTRPAPWIHAREAPSPQSSRFPDTAGHSALDPGSPSPPLYDPAELDEEVELDLDKKRRILDLYYRLEDMTYYQLLGVDEQADKKQVKSAYYAIAPEFHPDKYFRKNLGSYKGKIEALFARVTLAHDVLTVKERRAEYDEYLQQTLRNRAMSAMLDQAPRDMAAVQAAVEEAAAAAVDALGPGRYERIAPPPASGPPGSVRSPMASVPDLGGGRSPSVRPPMGSVPDLGARRPSVRPPMSSAPDSAQTPVPFSGPPASSDEALRARREALARKLLGGQRRPAPAAPPPPKPAPMTAEMAQRAAEALQQRREAAIAEARRQQLNRYMDTGRSALDRQDFAAAANAYRIALALAPDDPRVQATCNEAMGLAAAALAEGYWKQAVYEEGQGRWGEASLSYSKVCAGQPQNFRAHERVAFTTLKSGGNVRRAVEYARKAVEISPSTPELRVTLAQAYASAGLEKSAQGELDRARELAPNDPKVQALIAQVRAASPKGLKVS
jgi:curved DNA-binding protein CbpA